MSTSLYNINKDKSLDGYSDLFKCSSLTSRIQKFGNILKELKSKNQLSYRRVVQSSSGRTVLVNDKRNKQREMLMFASNNYLGFANHPYIIEKVTASMKKYGVGIAGPPLLNGYTVLIQELERRLSELKGKEDTMLFSSGYGTNVGLLSALSTKKNHFIVDKLSHASLFDGLKINQSSSQIFKHNDMTHLESLVSNVDLNKFEELFICAEGVYSMDGDLAPIPKILNISKKYGALTVIDDAHGTGVLGVSGGGTPEHFGVDKEVDIIMGTFSKAFSVTGGFLSADKELVNYMRYFSRPYVFSASLPPISIAAILAGLDLIEKEPWRRIRLLENTKYAVSKLSSFELTAPPEAGIISIKVPGWINIRIANSQLDTMGIFLNAIEYPAVPINQQRFRISMMAEHTKEDINKLVSALELVWEKTSRINGV